MDYHAVENKYRPLPFWSWNDKLAVEKSTDQVAKMKDAGIGGFFMHARGGLSTPYMEEAWFLNMQASMEESKKWGMYPWAYDENGWPSGFASGKINGRGPYFQQKYLKLEKGVTEREHILYQDENYTIYYEVNPFYIDILNGETTKVFIEEVYEVYYQRFGNALTGIFTDEPQLPQFAIPWSHILPEEYWERYHQDLIPKLLELFLPTGTYKTTRVQFWKMVTELFSRNYFQQIYAYCTEHGWQFTGHLLMEESLQGQMMASGAAMPHYEYFTMPGVDWLGRKMQHHLAWNQVASVAAQTGKAQILTETFAKCGHNIDFDEMRHMVEQQFVRGINVLCQHLEGYSLAGIRKRDYPPALFYQQPWWRHYKRWNDDMSRIGMILAKGRCQVDTLLIHPQTSVWICFDREHPEAVKELNLRFTEQIRELERKHILFHLGDELLMERHGRVEGNTLVIGACHYKRVILPEHLTLLDHTKALLAEYVQNGGVIGRAEAFSPNEIVDNPEVLYTYRDMGDETVHYVVNPTEKPQKIHVSRGTKQIRIGSGDKISFSGAYELQPYESILVVEEAKETLEERSEQELSAKRPRQGEALDLSGVWEIAGQVENALTLDMCAYSFDGVLQEEQGYVLNIQQRACDLARPVDVECVYRFQVSGEIKEMDLVCEAWEQYDMHLNGQRISGIDSGFFVDEAFRRIHIGEWLVQGENTLSLTTRFVQQKEVYENLEKAKYCETERNKLAFTMEIEPIYLVGAFAVSCDSSEELPNGACRAKGPFVLKEPERRISLHNIEAQGYPFFAGEMAVKKQFFLSHTDYRIAFPHKSGVNAVTVLVNGRVAGTAIYKYEELDLSAFLQVGDNVIELRFVNTLRNLLGPHHLETGESYDVSPAAFYKEKSIFASTPLEWNGDYCLVHVSLLGAQEKAPAQCKGG